MLMKKLVVKQLLNLKIPRQNHLQVNQISFIALSFCLNFVFFVLETPTSTTKRSRMGRRTPQTPSSLGDCNFLSALNLFGNQK